MTKAYWVSIYRSVNNPEALAAYAKLAIPAVEAAGGRFLVRSVAKEAYEAGLKERSTIVEFDSLDMAIAARESAAYQAAIKLLGDAVVRDFRIVEGL